LRILHQGTPSASHSGHPRTALALSGRYGAFSIGVSGVESTIGYIQMQEKRHRRKGFREELKGFLKKHGFAYTEEMLD